MTRPHREAQPASVTITGSVVDSSALAVGSEAQATVTTYGARTAEDPVRQVTQLIDRLRQQLDALDDDASTAEAAAAAQGRLAALEKEVTREERRPGHVTALVQGIAATVGGLGSVATTVTALVTAVQKLTGVGP